MTRSQPLRPWWPKSPKRCSETVVQTRYALAMSTPPSLTPEQRTAALEKAAIARRVRAEVRHKLKMQVMSFDELLELADNDQIVAKLKVLAVLESLPGVGKVKARRTMETVGISQSRRLRGLGSEQRKSLVKLFGGNS